MHSPVTDFPPPSPLSVIWKSRPNLYIDNSIQPAMASLVEPKDTFITDYPTFVYRDNLGELCGKTSFSWSGATPFTRRRGSG